MNTRTNLSMAVSRSIGGRLALLVLAGSLASSAFAGPGAQYWTQRRVDRASAPATRGLATTNTPPAGAAVSASAMKSCECDDSKSGAATTSAAASSTEKKR